MLKKCCFFLNIRNTKLIITSVLILAIFMTSQLSAASLPLKWQEFAEQAKIAAGHEVENICNAENTIKLRDRVLQAQLNRIYYSSLAKDMGSALFKVDFLRGAALFMSLANLILSVYGGKVSLQEAKKVTEAGWKVFLQLLWNKNKDAWTQAYGLQRAIFAPMKELFASLAIASSIYKDYKDSEDFAKRVLAIGQNLKSLNVTTFDQYQNELSLIPLPKRPEGFWGSFQKVEEQARSDMALIRSYLYAAEEKTFTEIFGQYLATCKAAENKLWQVSTLWIGACKMKKGNNGRFQIYADLSSNQMRENYNLIAESEDYQDAIMAMIESSHCSIQFVHH